LANSANILLATVQSVQLSDGESPQELLLASSADKNLTIFSTDSSKPNPIRVLSGVSDSPILSCTVLADRFLVFTSISGNLAIYDVCKDEVIAKRKDHAKYGIAVLSKEIAPNQFLLATAGWDNKIFLYRLEVRDGKIKLDHPFGSVTLSSSPESILFVNRIEDDALFLLCSRRDSTFLYYYNLSDLKTQTTDQLDIVECGKQNLAPYANSWVAFTPSAMVLCPTDRNVVAVATMSQPHMKILIVRLILPSVQQEHRKAQSQLVQTDDEAAAVLVHCSTMASQSRYSTPMVAWRPDGSGVWTNSEDGIIRGIEAHTGKIVARLQGHLPGSKIRCLWAGNVRNNQGNEEEWLVSGGFDQRLIVWENKPKKG
jgi:WD40 repeat protein